jgi:hypothetical protein
MQLMLTAVATLQALAAKVGNSGSERRCPAETLFCCPQICGPTDLLLSTGYGHHLQQLKVEEKHDAMSSKAQRKMLEGDVTCMQCCYCHPWPLLLPLLPTPLLPTLLPTPLPLVPLLPPPPLLLLPLPLLLPPLLLPLLLVPLPLLLLPLLLVPLPLLLLLLLLCRSGANHL